MCNCNYYDRIKFIVKGSNINQIFSFNQSEISMNFTKQITTDINGISTNKFILAKKTPWINVFWFIATDNGELVSVFYDFSAKVLESNYLKGICKDNIIDVMHYLNRVIPAIKIVDTGAWLENAKLCYIEVGKNIITSTSVAYFLKYLRIIELPSNFKFVHYKNGNLTIRRSGKHSEIINFYDKFLEMNLCGTSHLGNDNSENCLRIELKLDNFQKMRKWFNLNNQDRLTLNDVINFKSDIITDLVRLLLGNVSTEKKVPKTISAINFFVVPGFKGVLKEYGLDLETVKVAMELSGINRTNLKRSLDNIVKIANSSDEINLATDAVKELIKKMMEV